MELPDKSDYMWKANRIGDDQIEVSPGNVVSIYVFPLLLLSLSLCSFNPPKPIATEIVEFRKDYF